MTKYLMALFLASLLGCAVVDDFDVSSNRAGLEVVYTPECVVSADRTITYDSGWWSRTRYYSATVADVQPGDDYTLMVCRLLGYVWGESEDPNDYCYESKRSATFYKGELFYYCGHETWVGNGPDDPGTHTPPGLFPVIEITKRIP